MHDFTIEKAIQARGLNGERVKPEDIENAIVSEHYFTAGAAARHSGGANSYRLNVDADVLAQHLDLLTICVLVLDNGFTVTGKSACVDPGNFDEELGRQIARRNAIEEVWPLLGFRLRDDLFLHGRASAAG